jgi:hypothetical protein
MMQQNTTEQNDSSALENTKQGKVYLVELHSVVAVHKTKAQRTEQWADTPDRAV